MDEAHFSRDEREEIVIGCHVLLLTLADAVAYSCKGEAPAAQADKARRLLAAASWCEGTPAYHLCLARCYGGLGDRAKENEELGKATAARPRTPTDHFLLGNVHYRRQELRAAEACYEKVLQQQRGHFWANYMLAVCALQLDRPRDAVERLNWCEGMHREFVWLHLLRGLAYTGAGAQAIRQRAAPGEAAERFALAEGDFRKAEPLAKAHGSDATYVLLVNRAALRLQQQDHQSAIRDLQRAVRLAPERFQAHAALARACEDRDREAFLQSVRGYLGRLPALAPLLAAAIPAPPRPRYDETLRLLDQALALKPDAPAVLHHRAQVRVARQELDGALADLGRVIRWHQGSERERTPGDNRLLCDAYLLRGAILLRQARYPNALRNFDLAAAIFPRHATVHRLRAAALRGMGHGARTAEQSRGHYEQAALADDEFFRLHGSKLPSLLELRGKCWLLTREHPRAIAAFSEALEFEKAPGNRSRLLALRGWAQLSGLQLPKLARPDFEEAIRLDGSNADAYAGRGEAQLRLRELRGALADAGHAADLGKGDPTVLYRVARIFAQAAHLKRDLKLEYEQYWNRAAGLLGDALRLLRTEGKRAAFWRETVRPDSASPGSPLAPLLSHPQFLRLQSQYDREPK